MNNQITVGDEFFAVVSGKFVIVQILDIKIYANGKPSEYKLLNLGTRRTLKKLRNASDLTCLPGK